MLSLHSALRQRLRQCGAGNKSRPLACNTAGFYWVVLSLLLFALDHGAAISTANLQPLIDSADDVPVWIEVPPLSYWTRQIYVDSYNSCSWNDSYWLAEAWVPKADPVKGFRSQVPAASPKVMLALHDDIPQLVRTASGSLVFQPRVYNSFAELGVKTSRSYSQVVASLRGADVNTTLKWYLLVANPDDLESFPATVSISCMPLSAPRPCPRPDFAAPECSGQGTCKHDTALLPGSEVLQSECECGRGWGDYGCQRAASVLDVNGTAGESGDLQREVDIKTVSSMPVDFDLFVPLFATEGDISGLLLVVEMEWALARMAPGAGLTSRLEVDVDSVPVLLVKPHGGVAGGSPGTLQIKDAPADGVGDVASFGDVRGVQLGLKMQYVALAGAALAGTPRWYISIAPVNYSANLTMLPRLRLRIRWTSDPAVALCPGDCGGAGQCRRGSGSSSIGALYADLPFACNCAVGLQGTVSCPPLASLTYTDQGTRATTGQVAIPPGAWRAVPLLDINKQNLLLSMFTSINASRAVARPAVGLVVTATVPDDWPVVNSSLVAPSSVVVHLLWQVDASSMFSFNTPVYMGVLPVIDGVYYLFMMCPPAPPVASEADSTCSGQVTWDYIAFDSTNSQGYKMPPFTLAITIVGTALIAGVCVVVICRCVRPPARRRAPPVFDLGSISVSGVQKHYSLTGMGEIFIYKKQTPGQDPESGLGPGPGLASDDARLVRDIDTAAVMRDGGKANHVQAPSGADQAPSGADQAANDAVGGQVADAVEVCSTCLSSYVEGELLRRLPCAHYFHCPCVDPWLVAQASCPLCRWDCSGGARAAAAAGSQDSLEAAPGRGGDDSLASDVVLLPPPRRAAPVATGAAATAQQAAAYMTEAPWSPLVCRRAPPAVTRPVVPPGSAATAGGPPMTGLAGREGLSGLPAEEAALPSVLPAVLAGVEMSRRNAPARLVRDRV